MMLSKFSDNIPTEQELSLLLETNDKVGTHPHKIAEIAQSMGLAVLHGEDGTIENLTELTDDGFVVLLAISVDVPHWVVFLKANPVHLFVHDPFFGANRSFEIRKFTSEKQKFPHPRWFINPVELKKYVPEYDFTEVASNRLWVAFKKI
jgi:hypothetical protein